MKNPLKMVEDDIIQQRAVGDEVPDLKPIDPGLSKYDFGGLHEAVEFAKLMCQAGPMLTKHAQNNPAICLALTMRATHWGFDPFALADESYQAKDGGPVGYQAKVFTAVARKAGIVLRYRYEGEFEILDEPVKSHNGRQIAPRRAVGNLKCIAYAEDGGEVLEYETPELDQVGIKNSPLWHNDPRQQQAYYAGRGWMRRYRADLMMGAHSDDEVEQMPMRDVTPKTTGLQQLAQSAREEAKVNPVPDDDATDDDLATDQIDGEAEDAEPDYSGTPEYALGAQAAEGGLEAGDCTYTEDPEKASAWLQGFWSVRLADDPEEEGETREQDDDQE